MRITHVITGLCTGGAETMLCKLLAQRVDERDRVDVVSLTDVGAVGARIRELGIEVTALGMRRGFPDPRALWRLTRRLRRDRPDLVQTWMYHADLLGGLAARLAGCVPVVWGIRQSDLHPVHSRRTTIWTARACARLSRRIPDRIVSCSEAARAVHEDLGYEPGRIEVIPNGFDTMTFRPDAAARAWVRADLGIGDDTALVGMAARFDPQKDHRNFVRAAGSLRRAVGRVAFVLCGAGIDPSNQSLRDWIHEEGIEDCCHLLGERSDMPQLLAALDVAVLCSAYGEGFPNVVGEAMACGVPCVCTDVGDAAAIVGATGAVVPPGDADALAAAVRRLLEEDGAQHAARGAEARRVIVEGYAIARVARRYRSLYEEVLRTPRRVPA